MPANIAKDKYGFLSVYADEKPWHPEIGSIVVGAMSAEQVIKASRANGGVGLGFIVETQPAYAKVGGRFIEAPEHRAIVRKDSREVFGFASAEYKPIQNIDALRLPQAIVKTRQAGWISAGAIGNGAKLFATLDLSKLADVKIPGDPSKIKTFLSCTWSHDALEALRVGFSARRLECANMRRMQLASWDSGRDLSVRIIHAGNVEDQMEEARRVLGFATEVIADYTKLMTQLADIAVTPKWFSTEFLTKLIPIPPEMDRTRPREEAREAIAHLFAGSKTLVGVKPTAYRALQAVDEYADHFRPMRTQDPQVAAERRMRALLGDGPAADLKTLALKLLREEFELAPAKVPVLAGRN